MWLAKGWEGQEELEDGAAGRLSVKLVSRSYLIFYVQQQVREEMDWIILMQFSLQDIYFLES